METSAIKELNDIKFALDQSSIVEIADRNGVITYVNDNFSRISKYNKEELIGRSHRVLNSGYHPKEFFAELWNTITQGKVWKGEVRNRTKDGSLYWVDTTIVPFLDGEGVPYQYVVIRSDITERKKDEELLFRWEKLSVIGELAAGIAHEVRNPLTSIKGFVQLMRSQPDVDYGRYLNIILPEIDRIDFIVSQFMALAKPHLEEYKQVDLHELIDQVINILDPYATLYNISVQSSVEENIPLIECEAHQMKQVFVNLLKNAIESMGKSGKVWIEARMIDETRLSVRFIDEGCGIREEDIKKLGDPFFTTKEKGTGLGMMMCFKIIKAHNGEINIDSQINHGTTVEIILPIKLKN